MSLTEEIIFLL